MFSKIILIHALVSDMCNLATRGGRRPNRGGPREEEEGGPPAAGRRPPKKFSGVREGGNKKNLNIVFVLLSRLNLVSI